MSNAVFPTLPGIAWNVTKTPEFKTQTHRSVSGRELRATFQQYPLYTFDMSYEFLRGGTVAEINTLVGFFLARQGAFDSFLYTDQSDYQATEMTFGTGNGTQTQFQLARSYGNGTNVFVEPVQNVNVLSNIKVNGAAKVLTTDYTISSTGLVTFVSAPAVGAALTWNGTYYYRCRFVNDTADFNQFLKDLWEAKSISFVGATGNKV